MLSILHRLLRPRSWLSCPRNRRRSRNADSTCISKDFQLRRRELRYFVEGTKSSYAKGRAAWLALLSCWRACPTTWWTEFEATGVVGATELEWGPVMARMSCRLTHAA